jgi:plasmid stabilization system protein ParE
VKVRRVRFTRTAREHLRESKKWWRENRADQATLVEDVEDALFVIARLPGAGSPYADAPSGDVRRIYLRRVSSHLYYTFNDDEVVIRALWHASRGSGPRLVR